jgi:hypothetical protein
MYMQNSKIKNKKDGASVVNASLIGVIGQIGCISLVITLGFVFLGLWLDHIFNTRPILTAIFLFGSIPVLVIVLLKIARHSANTLKAKIESNDINMEEGHLGEYKEK